jgi:hypothetical protein
MRRAFRRSVPGRSAAIRTLCSLSVSAPLCCGFHCLHLSICTSIYVSSDLSIYHPFYSSLSPSPGLLVLPAFCFKYGWGCPSNPSEFLRSLEQAATSGHAAAQGWLGLNVYLMGSEAGGAASGGAGVAVNYESAWKWCTQSAAQGYPLGALGLGLMLSKGLGVAKNEAEAVKQYVFCLACSFFVFICLRRCVCACAFSVLLTPPIASCLKVCCTTA